MKSSESTSGQRGESQGGRFPVQAATSSTKQLLRFIDKGSEEVEVHFGEVAAKSKVATVSRSSKVCRPLISGRTADCKSVWLPRLTGVISDTRCLCNFLFSCEITSV